MWAKLEDVTKSERNFKSITLDHLEDLDIILRAKKCNVTFEKVKIYFDRYRLSNDYVDMIFDAFGSTINSIPLNTMIDVSISTDNLPTDWVIKISQYIDRLRKITYRSTFGKSVKLRLLESILGEKLEQLHLYKDHRQGDIDSLDLRKCYGLKTLKLTLKDKIRDHFFRKIVISLLVLLISLI